LNELMYEVYGLTEAQIGLVEGFLETQARRRGLKTATRALDGLKGRL